MIHVKDLTIRDPFILVDGDDYYLYGTTVYSKNPCFKVFHSRDLVYFDEPEIIFESFNGFWATKDFWAPEVHKYNGKYYLFASLKSENHCRATQIFVSESPNGKFIPLTDKPITPKHWECLDGTLYIEDDKPYIVFCREWLQVIDGEIYAMELSKDLKQAVSEPIKLFKATDASWVISLNGCTGYVTDGPFVFKEDGIVKMLWSSFGKKGYALGMCTSNSILGPWKQQEEPLYDEDGGHGMIFVKDGKKLLSLHVPNDPRGDERAIFIPYNSKIKV